MIGLTLVFAICCARLVSSENEHVREQDINSCASGTPQGDDSRLSGSSPKDRLAPGTCVSSTETRVCDNDSLPLLVAVAGVEGSGHHVVRTLFTRLSSFILPTIGDDPNHEWNKLYSSIAEEDQYEDRFREVTQLLESAKKSNRLGAMVFTTSSPIADRMYTAASPDDLIDMKEFECKVYRIKFVVTRRHPVAAVMASVERFGPGAMQLDKGSDLDGYEATLPYTMKARVIEGSLIYTDQQIRHLGCHQVHFLDYDKVIDESTRQGQLQALATFLGLSESETDLLLSAELQAPVTETRIPPQCTQCIEKTLYDFFEERKMMWPLMIPE